ncbi:hypothetical protein HanHA89_Chr12g0476061 [Helianthus annuus]|nr:hypothetical protein HanHA89_Chr12g0476061 [Helianthus annuus]
MDLESAYFTRIAMFLKRCKSSGILSSRSASGDDTSIAKSLGMSPTAPASSSFFLYS